MYKDVMRYWSRVAIRKLFIYHLIFFFILTPFLASCGGGSDSPDDTTVGPYPTEAAIVADAAETQNRSAQTAIICILYS
ncbi:MAG: hypothetical protein JRF40_00235 [Deltaproteobacteria bacterium]|nr:hypothetical protein [Deltaproteobacteria bacterium]MBW2217910.1 hypothetical protein [Deltaproteobacteria bacterium]